MTCDRLFPLDLVARCYAREVLLCLMQETRNHIRNIIIMLTGRVLLSVFVMDSSFFCNTPDPENGAPNLVPQSTRELEPTSVKAHCAPSHLLALICVPIVACF